MVLRPYLPKSKSVTTPVAAGAVVSVAGAPSPVKPLVQTLAHTFSSPSASNAHLRTYFGPEAVGGLPQAPAQQPFTEVTVRSGDTLHSVAQREGVPAAMLAAASALRDVHNLKPGQVLRVPHPSVRNHPALIEATAAYEGFLKQYGQQWTEYQQAKGQIAQQQTEARAWARQAGLPAGQLPHEGWGTSPTDTSPKSAAPKASAQLSVAFAAPGEVSVTSRSRTRDRFDASIHNHLANNSGALEALSGGYQRRRAAQDDDPHFLARVGRFLEGGAVNGHPVLSMLHKMATHPQWEQYFRTKRQQHEAKAEELHQQIQLKGGVNEWSQVNVWERGLGDLVNYGEGLVLGTLPVLAEAAIGGTLMRGLATAGWMTRTAAPAVTAKTANTAGTLGVMGATTLSSLGSLLEAQRDQTQGSIHLPSAVALTPLFVAANAFGITGLFARGKPMQSVVGWFDAIPGVKGFATRTVTNTVVLSTIEGGMELFQEGVVSQWARMVVDKKETFFNNPQANHRRYEAFAGGAFMGGLFGAGGGRRSHSGQGQGQEASFANSTTVAAQKAPLQLVVNGTAQEMPSINVMPLHGRLRWVGGNHQDPMVRGWHMPEPVPDIEGGTASPARTQTVEATEPASAKPRWEVEEEGAARALLESSQSAADLDVLLDYLKKIQAAKANDAVTFAFVDTLLQTFGSRQKLLQEYAKQLDVNAHALPERLSRAFATADRTDGLAALIEYLESAVHAQRVKRSQERALHERIARELPLALYQVVLDGGHPQLRQLRDVLAQMKSGANELDVQEIATDHGLASVEALRDNLYTLAQSLDAQRTPPQHLPELTAYLADLIGRITPSRLKPAQWIDSLLNDPRGWATKHYLVKALSFGAVLDRLDKPQLQLMLAFAAHQYNAAEVARSTGRDAKTVTDEGALILAVLGYRSWREVQILYDAGLASLAREAQAREQREAKRNAPKAPRKKKNAAPLSTEQLVLEADQARAKEIRADRAERRRKRKEAALRESQKKWGGLDPESDASSVEVSQRGNLARYKVKVAEVERRKEREARMPEQLAALRPNQLYALDLDQAQLLLGWVTDLRNAVASSEEVNPYPAQAISHKAYHIRAAFIREKLGVEALLDPTLVRARQTQKRIKAAQADARQPAAQAQQDAPAWLPGIERLRLDLIRHIGRLPPNQHGVIGPLMAAGQVSPAPDLLPLESYGLIKREVVMLKQLLQGASHDKIVAELFRRGMLTDARGLPLEASTPPDVVRSRGLAQVRGIETWIRRVLGLEQLDIAAELMARYPEWKADEVPAELKDQWGTQTSPRAARLVYDLDRLRPLSSRNVTDDLIRQEVYGWRVVPGAQSNRPSHVPAQGAPTRGLGRVRSGRVFRFAYTPEDALDSIAFAQSLSALSAAHVVQLTEMEAAYALMALTKALNTHPQYSAAPLTNPHPFVPPSNGLVSKPRGFMRRKLGWSGRFEDELMAYVRLADALPEQAQQVLATTHPGSAPLALLEELRTDLIQHLSGLRSAVDGSAQKAEIGKVRRAFADLSAAQEFDGQTGAVIYRPEVGHPPLMSLRDAKLTESELKVLAHLMAGRNPGQIAKLLSFETEHAVISAESRIRKKLGIERPDTVAELLARYPNPDHQKGSYQAHHQQLYLDLEELLGANVLRDEVMDPMGPLRRAITATGVSLNVDSQITLSALPMYRWMLSVQGERAKPPTLFTEERIKTAGAQLTAEQLRFLHLWVAHPEDQALVQASAMSKSARNLYKKNIREAFGVSSLEELGANTPGGLHALLAYLEWQRQVAWQPQARFEAAPQRPERVRSINYSQLWTEATALGVEPALIKEGADWVTYWGTAQDVVVLADPTKLKLVYHAHPDAPTNARRRMASAQDGAVSQFVNERSGRSVQMVLGIGKEEHHKIYYGMPENDLPLDARAVNELEYTRREISAAVHQAQPESLASHWLAGAVLKRIEGVAVLRLPEWNAAVAEQATQWAAAQRGLHTLRIEAPGALELTPNIEGARHTVEDYYDLTTGDYDLNRNLTVITRPLHQTVAQADAGIQSLSEAARAYAYQSLYFDWHRTLDRSAFATTPKSLLRDGRPGLVEQADESAVPNFAVPSEGQVVLRLSAPEDDRQLVEAKDVLSRREFEADLPELLKFLEHVQTLPRQERQDWANASNRAIGGRASVIQQIAQALDYDPTALARMLAMTFNDSNLDAGLNSAIEFVRQRVELNNPASETAQARHAVEGASGHSSELAQLSKTQLIFLARLLEGKTQLGADPTFEGELRTALGIEQQDIVSELQARYGNAKALHNDLIALIGKSVFFDEVVDPIDPLRRSLRSMRVATLEPMALGEIPIYSWLLEVEGRRQAWLDKYLESRSLSDSAQAVVQRLWELPAEKLKAIELLLQGLGPKDIWPQVKVSKTSTVTLFSELAGPYSEYDWSVGVPKFVQQAAQPGQDALQVVQDILKAREQAAMSDRSGSSLWTEQELATMAQRLTDDERLHLRYWAEHPQGVPLAQLAAASGMTVGQIETHRAKILAAFEVATEHELDIRVPGGLRGLSVYLVWRHQAALQPQTLLDLNARRAAADSGRPPTKESWLALQRAERQSGSSGSGTNPYPTAKSDRPRSSGLRRSWRGRFMAPSAGPIHVQASSADQFAQLLFNSDLQRVKEIAALADGMTPSQVLRQFQSTSGTLAGNLANVYRQLGDVQRRRAYSDAPQRITALFQALATQGESAAQFLQRVAADPGRWLIENGYIKPTDPARLSKLSFEDVERLDALVRNPRGIQGAYDEARERGAQDSAKNYRNSSIALFEKINSSVPNLRALGYSYPGGPEQLQADVAKELLLRQSERSKKNENGWVVPAEVWKQSADLGQEILITKENQDGGFATWRREGNEHAVGARIVPSNLISAMHTHIEGATHPEERQPSARDMATAEMLNHGRVISPSLSIQYGPRWHHRAHIPRGAERALPRNARAVNLLEETRQHITQAVKSAKEENLLNLHARAYLKRMQGTVVLRFDGLQERQWGEAIRVAREWAQQQDGVHTLRVEVPEATPETLREALPQGEAHYTREDAYDFETGQYNLMKELGVISMALHEPRAALDQRAHAFTGVDRAYAYQTLALMGTNRTFAVDGQVNLNDFLPPRAAHSGSTQAVVSNKSEPTVVIFAAPSNEAVPERELRELKETLSSPTYASELRGVLTFLQAVNQEKERGADRLTAVERALRVSRERDFQGIAQALGTDARGLPSRLGGVFGDGFVDGLPQAIDFIKQHVEVADQRVAQAQAARAQREATWPKSDEVKQSLYNLLVERGEAFLEGVYAFVAQGQNLSAGDERLAQMQQVAQTLNNKLEPPAQPQSLAAYLGELLELATNETVGHKPASQGVEQLRAKLRTWATKRRVLKPLGLDIIIAKLKAEQVDLLQRLSDVVFDVGVLSAALQSKASDLLPALGYRSWSEVRLAYPDGLSGLSARMLELQQLAQARVQAEQLLAQQRAQRAKEESQAVLVTPVVQPSQPRQSKPKPAIAQRSPKARAVVPKAQRDSGQWYEQQQALSGLTEQLARVGSLEESRLTQADVDVLRHRIGELLHAHAPQLMEAAPKPLEMTPQGRGRSVRRIGHLLGLESLFDPHLTRAFAQTQGRPTGNWAPALKAIYEALGDVRILDGGAHGGDAHSRWARYEQQVQALGAVQTLGLTAGETTLLRQWLANVVNAHSALFNLEVPALTTTASTTINFPASIRKKLNLEWLLDKAATQHTADRDMGPAPSWVYTFADWFETLGQYVLIRTRTAAQIQTEQRNVQLAKFVQDMTHRFSVQTAALSLEESALLLDWTTQVLKAYAVEVTVNPHPQVHFNREALSLRNAIRQKLGVEQLFDAQLASAGGNTQAPWVSAVASLHQELNAQVSAQLKAGASLGAGHREDALAQFGRQLQARTRVQQADLTDIEAQDLLRWVDLVLQAQGAGGDAPSAVNLVSPEYFPRRISELRKKLNVNLLYDRPLTRQRVLGAESAKWMPALLKLRDELQNHLNFLRDVPVEPSTQALIDHLNALHPADLYVLSADQAMFLRAWVSEVIHAQKSLPSSSPNAVDKTAQVAKTTRNRVRQALGLPQLFDPAFTQPRPADSAEPSGLPVFERLDLDLQRLIERSPYAHERVTAAHQRLAEVGALQVSAQEKGDPPVPGRLSYSPMGTQPRLARLNQYGLTPRQVEVLKGLVQGTSPEALAQQMDVSLKQVRETEAAARKVLGLTHRDTAGELISRYPDDEVLGKNPKDSNPQAPHYVMYGHTLWSDLEQWQPQAVGAKGRVQRAAAQVVMAPDSMVATAAAQLAPAAGLHALSPMSADPALQIRAAKRLMSITDQEVEMLFMYVQAKRNLSEIADALGVDKQQVRMFITDLPRTVTPGGKRSEIPAMLQSLTAPGQSIVDFVDALKQDRQAWVDAQPFAPKLTGVDLNRVASKLEPGTFAVLEAMAIHGNDDEALTQATALSKNTLSKHRSRLYAHFDVNTIEELRLRSSGGLSGLVEALQVRGVNSVSSNTN